MARTNTTRGGYTKMTNRQNKWAVGRRKELVKEFGGECYVRGCHEKHDLEFGHVRQTPLSRTGPRERKTVLADINKHRSSYKLVCQEHKHSPHTKIYEHDRRMAKLGRR
jgi:hypothetical protein